MNPWQAAILAILAAVLAAGFVWYERRRPGARLIALVAALAALAVAGRLVLTPVPNVVATTDIALITGFALGAGPGFAVGALAAPISNMWLGQGPWTPWQMAGWGLAGLLGALLAYVTRRRVSRFGIALACGAMGFVYGALLDLSVMVTAGGEQSLERYLAISARGIPFNVAHAVGNFAIALAAGPALVRMISRYRDRLEFTWHPGVALPRVAPVALLALLAAGSIAALVPARAEAGVDDARRYLERVQNSDGGFAATPGQSSSPTMTSWAALGLAASGRNPRDAKTNGNSPIDYLKANAKRLRSAGDFQRTILVVEAAGLDSERFGGVALVDKLVRKQSSNGSWDGQVNVTAYGILALRAAGGNSGAISKAGGWLRSAQNSDSGWGIGAASSSDPDSTGAAMQGLAVAGGGASGGVSYLRSAQRREGGWGLNETGITNSQSTAWAVQGLVAARVEPNSVTTRGRSGMDYLGARQASDGHYRYSKSSDQTPIWVTGQTLVATSRQALPVGTVPRGSNPTPDPDIGSTAEDERRQAEAEREASSPGEPVPGAGTGEAGPSGSGPAGAAVSEGLGDGRGKASGGGGRSETERGARDESGEDVAPGEENELAVSEIALGQSSEDGAAAGGDPPTGLMLGGLGALTVVLCVGLWWVRRRLGPEP
ncbi:hypothetical protein HJD18_06210 [Thermoleophilia bacterium SCSIO 60948]|nr:hypothetical protein HJD18_06210 [Thermoleophilia bacterium SCSIO 60948]